VEAVAHPYFCGDQISEKELGRTVRPSASSRRGLSTHSVTRGKPAGSHDGKPDAGRVSRPPGNTPGISVSHRPERNDAVRLGTSSDPCGDSAAWVISGKALVATRDFGVTVGNLRLPTVWLRPLIWWPIPTSIANGLGCCSAANQRPHMRLSCKPHN
jgi:hypothetical protein